jgi:hypothetical protein
VRRFINSVLGKAICHVLTLALIMPFCSLVMVSRAEAQLQTLPTWAVVEFEVLNGPKELGSVAAESVANELARTGKYDVVPQETMKRTMESLALQAPVNDMTSLLRLAAEVRATTIVRGQVVNSRVRSEGGGKKADVLMRVEVVDVASGLPVNGAALSASSSVRASTVEDATILNEAISMAAAKAVAEVNMRTLPQATILNTFEETALINHGTRSGFARGQDVIVLRGREQVATAQVIDVEPDSATIKITRPIKGHQPGDKVRVVFRVPTIHTEFTTAGTERVIKPRERGSNSGFTTMLLVLGVLGVLLGQGRSSGFNAAHDVKAEAMMFPDSSGSPAVRLSWSRDLFARGNSQTVQWQIHRSDVIGNPVLVVDGVFGQAVDTTEVRDVTYGDFGSQIGGNVCTNTSVPEDSATGVPGVVPGRPYTYSIELVYRVAAIDLPDGGNASTGGGTGLTTGGGTGLTTGGTTGATTGGTTGLTTGGTTGATTGATTGGTGGTTGTGGTADCFFISKRVSARGISTPLNPPTLVSPTDGQVVSTDIPFSFGSVVNPAFPITVQYTLQVSNSPTFPGNATRNYATFTRGGTGILSTGSITNLLSRLQSDLGAMPPDGYWWRIGARNVADKPGPVPDSAGTRYIYSTPRRFTIPAPPPPPPAE